MLRAAWRSLLGRKLRLLLSTLAIVFGVAFVVGTLMFTDTLNKSFTAIFSASVGDVVVRPAGGPSDQLAPTTLRLPGSLIPKLGDVEGAARADGNVVSFGVFVIGKNDKVIGGNGAPGLAVNLNDAPAAGGIEPIQVVRGEQPKGTGEVVLDAATARRTGYRIGETVRLVSSAERALLQPRLVGIADFPEGGSLNGATLAMFDTQAAQTLFADGKDEYSNAWVTARAGVSQQELRDQVAKVLPGGFEAVTGDAAAEESASELLDAISFLTIFLLVFAGIALVVGSFLIVNTFSMLVAQRSRELALFRALGASRRQVTGSVLFEALVVGLVGSTLGLGLGVLLAMGIRAGFGALGLDLSATGLVFAPRTVLAAYVVGVLVTLVAAWLPARRSSRIPPIAALRDDVAMPESAIRRRALIGAVMLLAGVLAGGLGLFGEVSKAAYWVGTGALLMLLGAAAASPALARPVLAVWSAATRRMFGAVGRLAGANTARNPRRTAATASALMIGLTLVTTMSIAGSSAKASVDAAVEESFLGDYVISNAIGQNFSPQIGDRVAKLPGVAVVGRERYLSVRFGDDPDRSWVSGLDANFEKVRRIEIVEGSGNLGPGQILLTRGVAEEHGVGVGDDLVAHLPKGPQELEVVGIHDTSAGPAYVIRNETLVAGGFADEDSAVYVVLAPDADPFTVRRELDAAVAALPVVTVKDQADYAAEQREPIDRMVLIIYALLGLALVIAVLGVVNTLGLSIIERTREIGLLRAVGLTRRQLRRMVSLESVALALLGALLGLALGLVFGIALMTSVRDEGLEVVRVPWWSLAGYLVSALVIGLLAALVPARRAARMDVLGAIGAE